MKLFVLRHGEAPYNAEVGERMLNGVGAEETERVTRYAGEQLANVTHIISSPVRRARETLAIVTRILNYQGKLTIHDSLRSEGSLQEVEGFVDQCHEPCILLLSHQPLVGQMVDYLADQPGLGYQMGTSCLACFDLLTFSRGCGQFEGIISPDAC